MRLTGIEPAAALYAVAGFVRQRQLQGRTVPPEVVRLFERLDTAVRVSRKRNETGYPAEDSTTSMQDELIGSAQAARMLGCTQRMVQLLAGQLGGQKISGRWCFRESSVVEYMGGTR